MLFSMALNRLWNVRSVAARDKAYTNARPLAGAPGSRMDAGDVDAAKVDFWTISSN